MEHPPHPLREPRALPLPERQALCRRLRPLNDAWLERLRVLAEPAPESDFPAFLLGTEAYRGLAERIGAARRRTDLPTAVVDEVDRFVDAFRYYLRTCAGEDSLANPGRRAS